MEREPVPLQYDLFTGKLVDRRTATQKQHDQNQTKPVQTELFTQREVAQFGVRARPQMSVSEHTRLVLIAEDPRTDEEIERDRERAAQALTRPLFAEPLVVSPVVSSRLPEPIDVLFSPPGLVEEGSVSEDREDPAISCLDPKPLSKWEVYQQLVTVFCEKAATVTALRPVLLAQRIAESVVLFEAKHAGLTCDEIQAAITIGEFQASSQKQSILVSSKGQISRSQEVPYHAMIWLKPSAWLEMSKI